MEKKDFLKSASMALRHDLINNFFGIRMLVEMDPEKHKEVIQQAFLKIDSLMELWRIFEEFTNDVYWQELKGLLMRIKSENSVSTEIEIDCVDVKIKANNMLSFVFRNLIENSIKYSGQKIPEISISSEVGEEGNLVIVYEDNGIGISFSDKERIFNQGYGKNTGLGMFLCRNIVEDFGGKITENGVPGEGISVRIVIPKENCMFGDL